MSTSNQRNQTFIRGAWELNPGSLFMFELPYFPINETCDFFIFPFLVYKKSKKINQLTPIFAINWNLLGANDEYCQNAQKYFISNWIKNFGKPSNVI